MNGISNAINKRLGGSVVIKHNQKIVYVGDHTHGWSIVVEGTLAHRDPDERSEEYEKLVEATYGNTGCTGGVVGCSEWMWMQKEDATRIVECWNALRGINNPEEWVEKMKVLEAQTEEEQACLGE